MLKLGKRRGKTRQPAETEDEFDSLAVYKHADESVDWRPCRIVRRELKAEFCIEPNERNDFVKGSKFELNYDAQMFTYWVEYLHLA